MKKPLSKVERDDCTLDHTREGYCAKHKTWPTVCDKQYSILKAERDELREALDKYGNCIGFDCETDMTNGKCYCGFISILNNRGNNEKTTK